MSGKVFIWSAPRSLSTAFTRAMMNVNDCEVFMEPYWHGHYSLWGDIYTPIKALTNQPPEQLQFSFDKTTEFMQAKSAGKEFVFCKEIAKDIGLPPNFLKSEKLHGFQHTFLIRHPEKTIPSLYRMYSNSKSFPDVKNIDFSYEGGFSQLYKIFEFANNHFDTPPIVIFADDLLEDPEKVLKYYCDHTGLPYRKGMSRWKPGRVEGWDPAEYYANVFESSGIGKLGKSSNRAPIVANEYPGIKKSIEDNIWYFEQMYERRVKF